MMRAAQFSAFGTPDVIELVEAPRPTPGPGEVVVSVTAAGVNHFDLQIRSGNAGFPIPLPFVGGMEAVGVVAEVGPGVDGWETGQRVLRDVTDSCSACRACRSGREWACVRAALTLDSISGAFSEAIVCDARRLVALPDEISDVAAAAIQMSYGTAWHMLFSRANLRAGETVLVSSVGSGLGSAAVDIAKRAGAYVIGTASTDEKLERSRQRGLDVGINAVNLDVAEEVARITEGRGVDVAFEHVGGTMFQAALESLAMDGRLVTSGWHGGGTVTLELMPFVRGRKTILGSVNRTLDDLHRCLELVERGDLTPAISDTFDLAQLGPAMRTMEERRVFGKVVVTTGRA